MTDDKRHQDNLSEEERSRIGQMGGKASHSGQKGGQAQSGSTENDTTDATNPLGDTSMNDEDIE